MEPSKAPWSSPVVMVKKHDGKYRMCIDYRRVNKQTKHNAYPIPQMEAIFRKLQTAKYISTIDLSSAYHQISIKNESRDVTSFTVPGLGLYRWARLPFGLTNAPACFQNFINKVITSELEPYCYCYLDDIIVATPDFESHLRVLEIVLRKLVDAKLTVNRDKSVFCQAEVKYLGILVNRDGFRPDPEKIDAIFEFRRPKTKKALQRFLGMASWYRKFIG